jgi:hypothetical protein
MTIPINLGSWSAREDGGDVREKTTPKTSRLRGKRKKINSIN